MTAMFLVCWTTACGGGAPETPDAAAPDAVVPDAVPPVEVDGKVFAVVDFQVTALEGVAVELHATGGGALLDTATTDVDGAYAFEVAPGLDAYVRVATAGRLPTIEYPPGPLAGGENLLLVVADEAEVGNWYAQAGDTFDASARTMIVAVLDADGGALAGATVAVAPAPATLTYYDPDTPAWDPALTSAPNGFALATTTAENVTVTASVGAPRTFSVDAGALTMAAIGP